MTAADVLRHNRMRLQRQIAEAQEARLLSARGRTALLCRLQHRLACAHVGAGPAVPGTPSGDMQGYVRRSQHGSGHALVRCRAQSAR